VAANTGVSAANEVLNVDPLVLPPPAVRTAVLPRPIACLCVPAGKRIDVNDSLAAIGIEDGGEIVAVQDQEGGCGVEASY